MIEPDTRFASDIFIKIKDKVKLLPDMLPAVALLREAFNQQGSTSASTTSAFGALTNGMRENESMTAHQTRMRESAEKILEMQFADLEAFLNSVQAFSSYTKMCDMRDQATIKGDNLKAMVWREACLKVCIDMSADPRPLTLDRINPILRDAYTALDDGLGGQEVLATNSLATKFQEHSDAVTKDLNTLKNTVLFKQHSRGRGTPRGSGRGNYRNSLTVGQGNRGSFRGGRGDCGGGYRGSRGGHSGRDDIPADASAQGGQGGREGQHSGGHTGAQHVYVAPTAFADAKKLLEGLCYTCGNPDHKRGDAASPARGGRR